MNDMMRLIFHVLLVVLIFIVLIAMIAIPIDSYVCKKQANTYELDYKYTIWTSCIVNENGHWIKIENRNQVYLEND
jgi:hypothetical protein